MPRKKTDPQPPLPAKTGGHAESRRISEVPLGDRRAFLEAAVMRLAAETDDTLWQKHKDECHCVCGMGDGRLLVAIVKELRSTLAELETIPSGKEESKSDDLAARRAARLANAAGQ